MGAAAGGRSQLGIPKKVGKEFRKATSKRQAKRLPERKRKKHG